MTSLLQLGIFGACKTHMYRHAWKPLAISVALSSIQGYADPTYKISAVNAIKLELIPSTAIQTLNADNWISWGAAFNGFDSNGDPVYETAGYESQVIFSDSADPLGGSPDFAAGVTLGLFDYYNGKSSPDTVSAGFKLVLDLDFSDGSSTLNKIFEIPIQIKNIINDNAKDPSGEEDYSSSLNADRLRFSNQSFLIAGSDYLNLSFQNQNTLAGLHPIDGVNALQVLEDDSGTADLVVKIAGSVNFPHIPDPDPDSVPEVGSTLALLGFAFGAVAIGSRKGRGGYATLVSIK